MQLERYDCDTEEIIPSVWHQNDPDFNKKVKNEEPQKSPQKNKKNNQDLRFCIPN